MNLHVRNGSGSTSGTINALGDPIVGYDEARSSGSDKSGSHNLWWAVATIIPVMAAWLGEPKTRFQESRPPLSAADTAMMRPINCLRSAAGTTIRPLAPTAVSAAVQVIRFPVHTTGGLEMICSRISNECRVGVAHTTSIPASAH